MIFSLLYKTLDNQKLKTTCEILWPEVRSYPSEPGLEGELSEEMEVTEATDRGLWEEGMVKERTIDGGRGPRRSSAGG